MIAGNVFPWAAFDMSYCSIEWRLFWPFWGQKACDVINLMGEDVCSPDGHQNYPPTKDLSWLQGQVLSNEIKIKAFKIFLIWRLLATI